jgi:hypothetical protein
MIWWLVVLPAALLLLALGVANWRVFHLAYCKHLMRSSDPEKKMRGTELVMSVHFKKRMTVDQARRVLSPVELRMLDGGAGRVDPFGKHGRFDGFQVDFDKDGRLVYWDHMPWGP